jgi:superfamily II RNA helicase
VEGEKEECLKAIAQIQMQIADLNLPEDKMEILKQRDEAEAKVKTAVNAAKKEAQRTLETLKNKQMGPVWDALLKNYHIYKTLKTKLADEESHKAYLDSLHLTKVEPAIDLLTQWGFLHEDKSLTELGILGSEINEGHPILMARAFQEGVWKGMEPEDFVAFLAGFLNEGKTNDETNPEDLSLSEKTREALNFADDIGYRCRQAQDKTQIRLAKEGYWDITTTWIEPLQKWMDGEDAAVICSEYGLYEGNFIRSVLKVANMVDEWISLATFTKTIELLQMLEGVKTTLVRDIVKPESLYLNLD